MFAKQANLWKAAKGSKDITSFFAKKMHIENPSPEPAAVQQHDILDLKWSDTDIEIIPATELSHNSLSNTSNSEFMGTKHILITSNSSPCPSTSITHK